MIWTENLKLIHVLNKKFFEVDLTTAATTTAATTTTKAIVFIKSQNYQIRLKLSEKL